MTLPLLPSLFVLALFSKRERCQLKSRIYLLPRNIERLQILRIALSHTPSRVKCHSSGFRNLVACDRYSRVELSVKFLTNFHIVQTFRPPLAESEGRGQTYFVIVLSPARRVVSRLNRDLSRLNVIQSRCESSIEVAGDVTKEVCLRAEYSVRLSSSGPLW